MESVESCRYEEGRTVNPVSECEGCFIVFYTLEEGEVEAKKDCQQEGLNCLFSFAFYNAVVGSGDCYT